ncbi:MAG: double zinc ribbon domain-containing protein, partial [Sphingomonas sp.]|nr:double zinc ribbon domain-containing protein [Sphingomonas sp.]
MRALLAPWRLAVDTALPPRCPGCGAVSAADHLFCAACWNSLRWLTPPWCLACRHPLGEALLCRHCQSRRPAHDGV